MYTTVPSNTGQAAGRAFMYAIQGGTSSAYTVIAYEPADIEVIDLDTGESLHTQSLGAGEVAFQTGVGDRRLRLVSTGDVEVWAGDTAGGTAIENLGSDISVTAGRDGREFYVHTLEDGFVIFAPNAGTTVDIGDGALVSTLDRDGFQRVSPADLPGGIGVYHVTSSQPIVIQTLGRAGGFSGIGSYVGGVSMRHRYDAVGTYPLTLTVTDRAGQTHTVNTTVDVQAGDPPVAQIAGPAVVDETFANIGEWVVPFDASGSSDDNGIFSYEWDFGDGSTGTGVAPSHSYTAPGTYLVTLTVTDHVGQQTTTTFTVEVTPNNPPVAETGGPYIFGEAAAEFGVWTVTVDAGGSSDDVGILDYEWVFEPFIVMDFAGTTIDTATWITTDGVVQDDEILVTGTGGDGNRHVFSVADTDRFDNLVFQARVVPLGPPQFRGSFARWGFKNSDSTDFSTSTMPHAIGFNNGDISVYENGSLQFAAANFPYELDDVIDVRITLKTSGAIYEIKRAEEEVWTALFESNNTTTESPLKVGMTVQRSTFSMDDARLEERYFTPVVSRTYTELGVYDATLRVWDHALQDATQQTTLSVVQGDPPVSRPGGPYALEEGNFGYFVGTASTDDDRIARYEWDFGNGDISTQPNPVRYFDPPGVFEVTLTVTDHALQTHQQTAIVGPRHIQSIDLSNVIRDWQALELSGTIAADITNPDSTSLDPFQVVFFEDTNDNRVFDAAQDHPRHLHGEGRRDGSVQYMIELSAVSRYPHSRVCGYGIAPSHNQSAPL